MNTTSSHWHPDPCRLTRLHESLLAAYGPQGWWPVLQHTGSNPTTTGSLTGYHPGEYDFPRSDRQRFEICVGAILTQNTAWRNVERALLALESRGLLAPHPLLRAEEDLLQEAIRPSGYFRMKARKLRHLAEFYIGLDGRVPLRDELLGVWGIGPETADSIRLYAYGQPEMVIDAYTRRVFQTQGMARGSETYQTLKLGCEAALHADTALYQEFHALLVEHAKHL